VVSRRISKKQRSFKYNISENKCLIALLTRFIELLDFSFPLSMTFIDRWATQLSLVPLLNVFSIIGTYSYTKYLRTVCINIAASKPEIHKLYFTLYIICEGIKCRLKSWIGGIILLQFAIQKYKLQIIDKYNIIRSKNNLNISSHITTNPVTCHFSNSK